MASLAVAHIRPSIVYPDTDGKPMAENTLQYRWIVTITGGIEYLFADDPNVFVAGDLFWYPVEGHPEIVTAPDTLVAFGRPKGDRGSYRQWEENGVAPQVVFEILSPSNRYSEMSAKFDFYQRYGVEEYYLFNPDPERLELAGYLRQQDKLLQIPAINGHVSPRLKVKFLMDENGLIIVRPDGQPFTTFEQAVRDAQTQRANAMQERQRAEQGSKRAEQERQRAELERRRADQLQAELEKLRGELRSNP